MLLDRFSINRAVRVKIFTSSQSRCALKYFESGIYERHIFQLRMKEGIGE